jgi:hypothetical protein
MTASDPCESFEAVMNKACRELPTGWEIEIRLEQGFGGVVLTSPSGDEHDFSDSDDSMIDQLNMAVAQAISIED